MTRRLTSYMRRTHVRAYERLRAWRRNESGFTAVEFAMVAMPFLMLVFGILSVSLYFFTNFTMENAVWQASRVIRTGQFQLGAGGYTGLSMDDRKKAFKAALCAKAPQFIDCNKAIILVQSNSGGFGSITQPTCATDGAMIEERTPSSRPAPRAPSCSSRFATPGASAATFPLSSSETCPTALC
jgi:Flp pilus assembly protein TadG